MNNIWNNYPDSQAKKLREFLISVEQDKIPNEDDIKKLFISMTQSNIKICILCDKQGTNFLSCPICKIYYYCSDNCMKLDKQLHSFECCNKNLPYENIRKNAKFVIYNILTKKYVII